MGEFYNTVKRDIQHHICATLYERPIKLTFIRLLRALITPEFRVVLAYRINNWLYFKGFKFISFWYYQKVKRKYNCDISPEASIGKGLRIVHSSDIIIGPKAIIGDDCALYNGVTLGNRKNKNGKDGMPQIKNNVLIGTGAKLLGPITIGRNVIIGANSVVIHSFDKGTIAGIPAKLKG